MPFAEPMTMATDYVLALLGGWLGWRLWRRGCAGPLRWWAAAFWALALAALLGGTAHGLAPSLGASQQALIWRSTLIVIGGVAVLLLQAVVATLGGSRWWGRLLVLEWALYAVWVGWIDSDFRFAVFQYAPALTVVLVVHAVLAVRHRPGAASVVAGVVVSFVAAGIQQLGLAPHPNFNHNDLYHVVQMVGLVLLYRGAAAGGAATKAPRRA
jgi:Family of unknown function (DUF6962)